MRSRTARRALALTALATLAPAASALAQAAPNPLRPGALYAATNEVTGNRISTFSRAHDGTLTPSGSFATGGTGSGGFEGSASGVVLANRGGEVAPINLNGSPRFLLATNTGSGSVSVFLTRPDGLELADVESAGLDHPISVTVSRGIVYVLNGGASNCLGGAPTITGFTLSQQGELTPIAGSTRPVSGGPLSGCSQVSFNPKGDVLVVTEKQADIVSTYLVDDNGVASAPIANQTSGVGPFGFTFTQTGKLLETENFGGAPGQGSAASYEIGEDGALTPISGSVFNMRSDTCWIVLTDDGRYAYTTNAMSNDISSYRVDPDGSLTLLQSIAAPADDLPAPPAIPADLSLSGDSRFLYARNVRDGDIFAFEVQTDGTLAPIQTLNNALPPGAIGVAAD